MIGTSTQSQKGDGSDVTKSTSLASTVLNGQAPSPEPQAKGVRSGQAPSPEQQLEGVIFGTLTQFQKGDFHGSGTSKSTLEAITVHEGQAPSPNPRGDFHVHVEGRPPGPALRSKTGVRMNDEMNGIDDVLFCPLGSGLMMIIQWMIIARSSLNTWPPMNDS